MSSKSSWFNSGHDNVSNNNNYSGYGLGNPYSRNNNSTIDSEKNSSVTSSVAGFALGGGGYKTPSTSSNKRVSSATTGQQHSSMDTSGGGVVNRYLAAIYKNLAGEDIKERKLEEAVTFLQAHSESKTKSNETRHVEKLKIHLIHQGRHNEAKRFMEMHLKLKGMHLIRNREAIVGLLYELFDKEATRAALTAKRGHHNPATSAIMSIPKLETRNQLSNNSGNKQSSILPNQINPNPNVNTSRSSSQGHKEITTTGVFNHASNAVFNMSRPATVQQKQHDASSFSHKSHLPNGQCSSNLKPTPFISSKSIEKDLIKDLVFIFQGIDGKFIKSNTKGYEIVSKQTVHPSLCLQTLRLCELGFFYKKIRHYCDKPIIGLMAHGLKHALEMELQEYYRLLAIVQSQIQQTTFDTPMSEDLTNSGEIMTILKLTVWMLDCRPRLEVLAGMIDACEGRRGGELCSVLYKYSLHGDPMICSVTNSLLSTVAKALYLMLCEWILYGELEDPFGEFFIAADSSCKKEHLWRSKYYIRPDMLPSFITFKQAERVLATGKNINYLKEICHNAKEYEGRSQIKSLLERSPVECMFMEEDKLLNSTIEKAYKTTSEMVLKVLIQESKLMDHMKAIKNYLLLGQGDFIQHLLELIQDELQKPASKLYTHNISAILESAVRATNAQFENEDILSRLDTRILPSSDKDLGWDVFCLDYKVHGPIGTVLTEDVMIRYNQLFNALWRTKRIEMILSTLWKNQTTLFKFQRFIPELGPVLHRSQLLISEMIHFVHQTQYYIMFEATECAWDKLLEEVGKATDLDEVIKAHDRFLKAITSRSLLDPESRELLNQLRGIFDSVHELKSFLLEFDSRVAVELQSRKVLKPNSNEQQAAQKQFFANYIIQAKGKIETLYTTTQDLVRSFLLVLNRQPDLTLQCLSFRLDFNEYYHFKDSRLSQPLTFQHRRRSSNTFHPCDISLSGTGLNTSLYASMSIPECVEN